MNLTTNNYLTKTPSKNYKLSFKKTSNSLLNKLNNLKPPFKQTKPKSVNCMIRSSSGKRNSTLLKPQIKNTNSPSPNSIKILSLTLNSSRPNLTPPMIKRPNYLNSWTFKSTNSTTKSNNKSKPPLSKNKITQTSPKPSIPSKNKFSNIKTNSNKLIKLHL